ncbi:LptF/LptG permease family protein [Pedobacter hiemivivus]|uniref:Uncharacterized protein n=1 Tax=Pedobacter hiemivivus TaxID=2530454 RepID=A0A4R0NAG5_9SPHI|nr:hypothetical protein [Pedobacter hiemivivus]TCC97210.1 hypothetical protein EZ444_10190 [Pedobacter hiemivivus]
MDKNQIPLEEQVKIAERDKYIAESKKALAEADKIYFEYGESKRESQKKWWQTKNFRQQLIAVLLGVSLIGFYLNYVVIPTTQAEAIRLNLKNAVAEKNLDSKAKELDSIKKALLKNGIFLNSFRKNLTYKAQVIDSLKKTINDIQRTNETVNLILSKKRLDTIKLNLAQNKLRNLNHKFGKQETILNSVSKESSSIGANEPIVHFRPKYGNQLIDEIRIYIYSAESLRFSALKEFVISKEINSTSLPQGDYYLEIASDVYKLKSDVKSKKFTVDLNKNELWIDFDLEKK